MISTPPLSGATTDLLTPGASFRPMQLSPAHVGKFLVLTLQLGCVLTALWLFGIEKNFHFDDLLPVIFGGFVIHAWLPYRARLPFFVALSLFAFALLAGLDNAACLVAAGLGLISICHIPVSFRLRAILLLLAGAGLAWLRIAWSGPPPPPDSPALTLLSLQVSEMLPALGAIFMFRLAVYLYDLRHQRTPSTISQRLAYFFLLPNICFPLFPVIDYATFRRTYYDAEQYKIYQKGVQWMCRGLIHLVLYRASYHYLAVSPEEVENLGQLVLFVTSAYLIYLRISGTFHIIIGILCLFGFNLPESNHLYFLASSVTDFWRRINIYWKDFMMKMVYYPIFAGLRKGGVHRAIVIGTIATLLISWILHSYQVFWIRNVSFPVTHQDAVFWTLLGVLVAIQSVREAKRGAKKALEPRAWTMRNGFVQTLKIVWTFSMMSFIWAFWSCPDTAEWWTAVLVAADCGIIEYVWLVLAVVGIGLLGALAHRAFASRAFIAARTNETFNVAMLRSGATAALLLIAGLPAFHDFAGLDEDIVFDLTDDHPSRGDEIRKTRGYYEDILDRKSMRTGLWSVSGMAPPDWVGIRGSNAIQPSGNMLVYELIPSHESVFKRTTVRTNRWGMRDDDYEKAKPKGTYRIALLGGSNAMGSAVEMEETFQYIVEQRLNQEKPGGPYERYEILCFGVPGYSIAQSAFQLESQVIEFEPDAVLIMATSNLSGFCRSRFVDAVRAGVEFPYPEFERIKKESGIAVDVNLTERERSIQPYRDWLVEWSLDKIATVARDAATVPSFVLLPRTLARDPMAEEIPKLLQAAEDRGFVVMNLEGVWTKEEVPSVQIAPYDAHPNVEGHRRIANRLWEEMMKNAPALGLRN